MSNRRSPNKAYIGGYILKPLHDDITRMAAEEGMARNRFGFVEKLIREAVARRSLPVAQAA